jgi:predicted nucleic acid-binding protein
VHEPVILYWDSSAIISLLFRDQFSENARAWLRREGYHLISSLTLAEAYGVLARLKKERLLAEFLIDEAYEILGEGPWRRINIIPSWDFLTTLASRVRLCGSLLWHIAAAKTLQRELPELMMLSYDENLRTACIAEKMEIAR